MSKKTEDLVKELSDEDIEAVKAEDKRRQAERDKAIQEKEAYVRYRAFAMCNKCHRRLSEDVFKNNQVCPYCGSESATLIEHEEEKE